MLRTRHFGLFLLVVTAGLSALAAAVLSAAPAATGKAPAAAAATPTATAAGEPRTGPIKTVVVQTAQGWVMGRDGKPFFIKGAGGDASKPKLVEAGGNSYRTWGPPNQRELDEAQKLGLAVTVGLWLGGDGGFDYSKPDAVARQLQDCKNVIERLKNHPAVLMWGIGNEMEGPGKPGDNPALWQAIDDIAAAAKKLDPNHPTMTVIAEIGGARVRSIHRFCPNIDVVGINSYGGVATIGHRYRAAGGSKPYVVTEFGPPGTWELASARPAASPFARMPGGPALPEKPPEELTSTAKADTYRKGWVGGVAAMRGLCLGGYAFTWGNKWEATATWYGMFLPDGSKLEAVDAMTELWSGKPAANRCPKIVGIKTLGGTTLAPGARMQAAVTAVDPEGDPLTTKWALHPEGGSSKELAEAIKRTEAGAVELKMPAKPGNYRLYVYVRDGQGGAATGNVSLTVKGVAPPAPPK